MVWSIGLLLARFCIAVRENIASHVSTLQPVDVRDF